MKIRIENDGKVWEEEEDLPPEIEEYLFSKLPRRGVSPIQILVEGMSIILAVKAANDLNETVAEAKESVGENVIPFRFKPGEEC
jgi:hypothetical protein